MDIRVLDDNPLYAGQTYRLKFRFSNNYPIGATPTSNSVSFRQQLLTILQKRLK